jgi:outer membrane autotransporter protein
MKSFNQKFYSFIITTSLVLLFATTADAADITWTGNTNNNWNTNANWSSDTTPDASDTAIFDGAIPSTIRIAKGYYVLNGMQFQSSNTAYQFNLSSNAQLTLQGDGITDLNNGAPAPTFNIQGGSLNFINNASAGNAIVDNMGYVTFNNTATAGTSHITNMASLAFNDNASADHATIDNYMGLITFSNQATADNATINNQMGNLIFGYSYDLNDTANAGNAIINNDSYVTFYNYTSAANAAINNDNDGQITFHDYTSAANAHITNNSGNITFDNYATAGNSTITNGINGTLTFYDASSAGHATLINNGGIITFSQNSDINTIGDPRLVNNSGKIDFSALSGKTITLAELNGNGGTILLGNNTLEVDGGVFDGTVMGSSTLLTNINSAAGSMLIKVGPETLTLNGDNDYSEGAIIEGGTLMLGDSAHTSASITGPLNIQAAGTLAGYGVINGNVVNAGTISPGGNNPLATIIINGNYTQQLSSIYHADFDSQGDSDQLIIHGTAQLNGGTLQLDALSNGFKVNCLYNFITAQSINGQFANVVKSPFLNDQLIYSRTTVDYIINYNPVTIDHAVQTPNQIAVANYIQATGATLAINNAISDATTGTQFRALMDQLSGATYANQTVGLAEMGNAFDTQLDNHDATISLLPANDPKLWVSAQTGFNQLSDSSNASGLITHSHGLAIGSDFALSNKTTIGAALGLTNFDETATDQEIANTNGNLYQLGAYVHHAIKNWRLGAELSYGFTDSVDAKRTIQTTAGNAVTTGNYHSDIWSARGNVGYVIPLPSTLYHVQPFTGVVGQRVNQNSFTENSNTGFELNVGQSTYQSLRSQLGVSADAAPFVNTDVKLFTNLSWEHEFADTRGEFNANFVGVNGGFNVVGTDIGRDAAALQAGIKLPLYKNGFDVSASYQGRFANNLRENLGLLQVGYNFN